MIVMRKKIKRQGKDDMERLWGDRVFVMLQRVVREGFIDKVMFESRFGGRKRVRYVGIWERVVQQKEIIDVRVFWQVRGLVKKVRMVGVEGVGKGQ